MRVAMITTVLHDTDNLIIRAIPVSSCIIEITDSQLAIIDTGMAGNPDLIEELAELGYSPSDFNLVMNTHLHPDHIGGNRLFTNARILISRRELEYEKYFSRVLKDSNDPLKTLRSMGRCIDNTTRQLAVDLKKLAEEFPADILVGEYGQIEFYEDKPDLPGCLSLMPVPGHSIDSRAVLINGTKRRVVAAGDAFYHRDLWKSVPYIGIHYNDALFKQNVELIAGMPDIIIPGHDRMFDNLTLQYLKDDFFRV